MPARRRVLIIGGIAAGLILFICGALAGISLMLLRPVETAGPGLSVPVEIEPGASTGQIAADLSEKGLIRSPLIFQIYARCHRLDKKFKAGFYELDPSMELPEIAARLLTGDVETKRFTIPEGFTVEQIAGRLAEEGLVNRKRFLKIAARPEASLREQFPFLEESASRGQVKYVLEGYLFPDTYVIPAGSSEEDITAIMLLRFAEIFNEKRRRRCEELGLSLHEAVTLASIVEGEAQVAAERKRIAGVFHNRLTINMLLGACATVQYILPERKEVLSYADTRLDSPYNTYLYPGLPPGPVGAPGEASLEAALCPEESDYLFFVSKQDGTGEHYFSRTEAEHFKYDRIAKENKGQ